MGNLFSGLRLSQARPYAVVTDSALILAINQIAV